MVRDLPIMSVANSVLTSLLSGTANVAATTGGMVMASASEVLSPPAQSAIYLLGGLAFLSVLGANLMKILPAVRAVLGAKEEPSKVPRPDIAYGPHHHLITRPELDERLRRIEDKIDANAAAARRDLKDLTDSINLCIRDMTARHSHLEGQIESLG